MKLSGFGSQDSQASVAEVGIGLLGEQQFIFPDSKLRKSEALISWGVH